MEKFQGERGVWHVYTLETSLTSGEVKGREGWPSFWTCLLPGRVIFQSFKVQAAELTMDSVKRLLNFSDVC